MNDDIYLLKLARQYKDNEVVLWLRQKIKDLKVENGKLKSQIQELEDNKGFTLKDKEEFGKMKRDRDYWMQKALSNKL